MSLPTASSPVAANRTERGPGATDHTISAPVHCYISGLGSGRHTQSAPPPGHRDRDAYCNRLGRIARSLTRRPVQAAHYTFVMLPREAATGVGQQDFREQRSHPAAVCSQAPCTATRALHFVSIPSLRRTPAQYATAATCWYFIVYCLYTIALLY